MSLYLFVLGGFGALLSGWLVVSSVRRAHNSLVTARKGCTSAWSNVEVLLQRRHDEVGNLVELAGEYMDLERDVVENIIDARERALDVSSPEEAAVAQVDIRDSVHEFYAIAEETPELRTDEKFADVRDSLQTVEQRLENRREYYNDAVRRYNALLEQVLERYIAARRGYKRWEPFEAAVEAKGSFSVRERLQQSN